MDVPVEIALEFRQTVIQAAITRARTGRRRETIGELADARQQSARILMVRHHVRNGACDRFEAGLRERLSCEKRSLHSVDIREEDLLLLRHVGVQFLRHGKEQFLDLHNLRMRVAVTADDLSQQRLDAWCFPPDKGMVLRHNVRGKRMQRRVVPGVGIVFAGISARIRQQIHSLRNRNIGLETGIGQAAFPTAAVVDPQRLKYPNGCRVFNCDFADCLFCCRGHLFASNPRLRRTEPKRSDLSHRVRN
ncbi:MAG: hypothetical protein WBW33_07830 [Bryobacteraceae bacterium]